jgi:hypothetical protein
VYKNIYPVTENGCFYQTEVKIAAPPLYMETGTDPFAEIGHFENAR